MRLKVLVSSLVLLASLSFVRAADKFNIDPAHSSVGFSVKHMMVSNVKGRFRDFSGVIFYDDKDVAKSSVNVTIQTNSLSTDNDKRDAHVKSPDFLDAEKYPMITFKSKTISRQGEGYVAQGTLTVHGVSKEVGLPFTLGGVVKASRGGARMGADAQLAINRQDYGIAFNKAMDTGGLMVGNEVKIDLSVEAVMEASAPAMPVPAVPAKKTK